MGEATAVKAGSNGSALQIAVAQRFASGFAIDATLDAELRPESAVELSAPSGAGPTTILRQIAALERPEPASLRFGAAP